MVFIFFGQYRINRQESLTRDFPSEKGVKPQEYFVYFKVLQTNFWRERSVRIRRRIYAMLPFYYILQGRDVKGKSVPAPEFRKKFHIPLDKIRESCFYELQ